MPVIRPITIAPIYTCTDCQDTGYLPNREKCHCFKQAIIRLLYEQSGLEKSLSTENFDHLSYDYYEGEALECFRRTVAISKNFIETFDSDYHNLFFYGTVGTASLSYPVVLPASYWKVNILWYI